MTPLRFDVLTLFPGAFTGPLDVSMIRRARESGLVEIALHDIREHATDRHRSVDDYPFGGGQGMVMRVDVLDAALGHVRTLAEPPGHVVYLTPQGEPLTDRVVRQLAHHPRLILVCGRYEGVDERFIEQRVDREISIGDYVLTGGELPAMVLIDAVSRHVPGVLGDEASPADESFADGLLEHPQYTRPAEYHGWKVPEVLLGGDHASIERWRQEQRVERTRARRPDRLPPQESAGQDRHKVGINGVRVRSLNYPADVPALAQLWRAAGYEPGPLDEPRRLAALLDHAPGLAVVAEQAGQVIAAAVAGFDGLQADLYRVAVDPANRRRGIGSALVSTIEDRARQIGCQRIAAAPVTAEMMFLGSLGWREWRGLAYVRDL